MLSCPCLSDPLAPACTTARVRATTWSSATQCILPRTILEYAVTVIGDVTCEAHPTSLKAWSLQSNNAPDHIQINNSCCSALTQAPSLQLAQHSPTTQSAVALTSASALCLIYNTSLHFLRPALPRSRRAIKQRMQQGCASKRRLQLLVALQWPDGCAAWQISKLALTCMLSINRLSLSCGCSLAAPVAAGKGVQGSTGSSGVALDAAPESAALRQTWRRAEQPQPALEPPASRACQACS